MKTILLFIFTIFLLNPLYSYSYIEKLDWVWNSCRWCNKDEDWNIYLYFNKFDWIYSNNYEFFKNEDLLKDYCDKNLENCSKNKYIKNQDWTILKTVEVEKYTNDELKNKFRKISYSTDQINKIIQGIISPSPNKFDNKIFYNSFYKYSDSVWLSSFIKDNLNSLKFDIENSWIKLDITKWYRNEESYSPFYFWTTITVSDSNNSFFEENWYKYWFVSISNWCNRGFNDKNTYRWITIPLSTNYQKYKQDWRYSCIDEYLSDLSKRKKEITTWVKDITSILREPYRYTLWEDFIDHFAYLEDDFNVTLLKKYVPDIYEVTNTTNLEEVITYEWFTDWKTFLKNVQFLKGIDKEKFFKIEWNKISFFVYTSKQDNIIIEWKLKNERWEIIHIDFDAKEGIDYIFCSENNCDTSVLGDNFSFFKVNDNTTVVIKWNKYNYGKYYSYEDLKNILKEKDVYPFFYLPYVISSNWISLTETVTKDNVDIVNLIYVWKDWTISKNIFKDKEWNILIYKRDLSIKDILWDEGNIKETDYTNFKKLLESQNLWMLMYWKMNSWSYYSYLSTRKNELISKTWIIKVLTKDFNNWNLEEKYKDMFVSLYNFKKNNLDIPFLNNVRFYLIHNKEISKSTPIMCIYEECYLPEKWNDANSYFKRVFNLSKIEEFAKTKWNIQDIEKMILKMNKLEYIPEEYSYMKNSIVYILWLPYSFKVYWDKIRMGFGIFFIIMWIVYYLKRRKQK